MNNPVLLQCSSDPLDFNRKRIGNCIRRRGEETQEQGESGERNGLERVSKRKVEGGIDSKAELGLVLLWKQ